MGRFCDVVAGPVLGVGGQSGLGGIREGALGCAWLGTAFLSPTGHWWPAHIGMGAGHWCLLIQLVSTALGFCACLEAEGGEEGGVRNGLE